MTRQKNWRPRLYIDITPEQHKAVQELIPWGLTSYLFRPVIDTMVEYIRKHGNVAIAAFIAGDLTLIDIIRGQK